MFIYDINWFFLVLEKYQINYVTYDNNNNDDDDDDD
jgi:hypothetical protein